MFTPSINVDDSESFHLNFDTSVYIVFTLILTLHVNDVIQSNVFLLSLNTSVNPRVSADVRCKCGLKCFDILHDKTEFLNINMIYH